jgi:zinc D-Ala-D-Ala carboxypeptidase
MTKHFTLNEFIESQTARRRGIDEQFRPPAHIRKNLQALAENILEPLRAHTGPIRISSGYRCKRLNAAVGGSISSQHMQGQAADIISADSNISNATLFNLIISLNLPFDQLIWEYGTKINPAWVHVSFGPRNRKQILYIPNTLRP